jgi:S-adenosylmethionine hydrolase
VVDPGVGSARACLAIGSDGRFLVGPDNGILSPALLLAGARTVALPVPPTASSTFHARDVFAPAAAALARGAPLESLGSPHDTPIVRRTREAVRREDGAVLGEVIAIDRFGNAITNLLGARNGVVAAGGRPVPIRATYADVAVGAPVAISGSNGLLEIAVREGSAAAALGLVRGTTIVWYRS